MGSNAALTRKRSGQEGIASAQPACLCVRAASPPLFLGEHGDPTDRLAAIHRGNRNEVGNRALMSRPAAHSPLPVLGRSISDVVGENRLRPSFLISCAPRSLIPPSCPTVAAKLGAGCVILACAGIHVFAAARKPWMRGTSRTSDVDLISTGARALGHEPAFAALCTAFEEQRLTGNGRDRGRLERLGDQKCRLGPLAGEEALRIGGDEDHRHLEGL